MQAKINELKQQAIVFSRTGEPAKARRRYKKILALGRWHRDVSAHDLAEARIALGRTHFVERHFLRAILTGKRALAFSEKKIGPRSSETASALGLLADIYEFQARTEAGQSIDWHHAHRGDLARTIWDGAYQRSPARTKSQSYRRRQEEIDWPRRLVRQIDQN